MRNNLQTLTSWCLRVPIQLIYQISEVFEGAVHNDQEVELLHASCGVIEVDFLCETLNPVLQETLRNQDIINEILKAKDQ